MPTLLVVDSNCLGHISKHAMRGLSSGDKATGVIFGFLGQLLRLAIRFDTNWFVFAWDSRKSWRKRVYPQYKANRVRPGAILEEIEERILAFKQFVELRQHVLPKMGFGPVLQRPGYEADDIIASVVQNTQFGTNIVVSTDHDLYQLLDYCSIYNPITKKIITKSGFVLENGIEPKSWATVKAVAGCFGDNVGGVLGVGDKTAIKFINGSLLGKTKAYKNITSREGQAIIERNRKLVTLPYPGLDAFYFTPVDFMGEFREQDFVDICMEYGFKSFLRNIEEWKTAFRMVQEMET